MELGKPGVLLHQKGFGDKELNEEIKVLFILTFCGLVVMTE